MKVYKLFIYAILLIVSLVSVGSFADTRNYTSPIGCITDDDGYAVKSNGNKFGFHSPLGNYVYNGKSYHVEFKYSNYYYVACPKDEYIVRGQEPEPEVCNADYPNSPSTITLTAYNNLPYDQVHYQNTSEMVFPFEGCGYRITKTTNTEKDWQNICYNFSLVRSDIAVDSPINSGNVENKLTDFRCEERPKCGADNPASVAFFGKDKATGYPKGQSGMMEFAGCAYSAEAVPVPSNSYSQQCYNYTFTRLEHPVTPVNNTTPDFSAFECLDKTCPTGQYLDAQGICQNTAIQCPSGQHSENGVCVNNSKYQEYFEMTACTHLKVTSDYMVGGDDNKYYQAESLSCLPSNVYFSSKDSIINYLISKRPTGYFYLNSGSGSRFSLRPDEYTNYSTGEFFVSYPQGMGRVSQAQVSIAFACADGSKVRNKNSCIKICPNGVEVQEDADCSSSIQNCPDGSTVDSALGQTCPTKICPNGDEISSNLTCPVVDDNDNSGGTGDSTGIINAIDNNTEVLATKYDSSTVTLGQKLDNNTTVIGQKLDVLTENMATGGSQAIVDILNEDITVSAGGSYSLEDAHTQVTDIKKELSERFESIKIEAKDLITLLDARSGSFDKCYKISEFMGNEYETCFTEFEDEMKTLSNGVLFIFTVISIFIVLRGVN
ncbi:MAG: hypothetical protein GY928_02580 [Colwellia sp.]|nr:hypothetical protein [Colwellia sp.]